ncbi:MAG: phosphoribosyltransferase family protein [Patescibacteria group bacterium]
MKIETQQNEGMHSESLTEVQTFLCDQLFDIGAIKFGDFKLKLHQSNPEAPLSPIYINLRKLQGVPTAKNAAVSAYEELLRPLHPELLAGIPRAATPVVSSLADRFNIGMITPWSETKLYGSEDQIDGLLPEHIGKKVVLVDDLVSHADSKLQAAATLKLYDLDVKDIVVLIDRQQGGAEQLAKEGFTLHKAFTLSQMLDHYLRSGQITGEKYRHTQERLISLNRYSA